MRLGQQIKRLVRKGTDLSAAAVARKVLEEKIAPYGTLRELRWDSLKKTAKVEVILKGETIPASIWVERYELVLAGDRTYFVLREAKASREWMELLIQDFLLGTRLEIPAKYTRLARALL